MKERCKILNSIYYDLLLQKYVEKIGDIGTGTGVKAGNSLDTRCWGRIGESKIKEFFPLSTISGKSR
jgi:hypothetical protein